MKKVTILMFCIFCLFQITDLAAAEGQWLGGDASIRGGWSERFQPYEDNYAIWQFSKGDEGAAEVQYSFKYKLYDCALLTKDSCWSCDSKAYPQTSLYLSYTGKFDFYMETRYSGPVINRTSNPALHARLDYDRLNSKHKQWVDLSYEHRSDGQTVDVNEKDGTGQFKTEVAYRAGDHEYFDKLSRGANYFKLAHGWSFLDSKQQQFEYAAFEVNAKLYTSHDSDITWGKYAGTDTSISDFDLVRIKGKYNYKFGSDSDAFRGVTLGVEYTLGYKGLDTDSLDAYLVLPYHSSKSSWAIPIYIKAHFGPMDRLSDYTQSINSVGIGLALSY